MKRILFSALVLMSMVMAFSSCSKDDEQITLSQKEVVGKWNVTSYATTGSFEEAPEGFIYINLKSDYSYSTYFLGNSYVGTYKVNGNTVTGTTLDPITETMKFDKLSGGNATISYSNSEGESYKFKATRE